MGACSIVISIACFVPARWVGGSGALAASLGMPVIVCTTIGSIPMASRPASVTTSVVPCPSPVSRQSGSPLRRLASTSCSQPSAIILLTAIFAAAPASPFGSGRAMFSGRWAPALRMMVADATNRFSLNAPASLFNHAGAGHQVKVNKASATDTGSFIFQTGFSGRAEVGLTGSDDFQIKVSPDGSVWNNGLAIEAASGRTTINALALASVGSDPVLPPNGALWYNSTTGKFRGRQAGTSVDLVGGAAATAAYGVLQANYTLTSVTTAQKLFNWSTNGALTLAAGTYRFSCSLLITSMSTTSGSAKFDLKGTGSAVFGKMSMQDFGSRGTVAVGGTTATSGTASDVPASGGVLATAATSAALRASIHGTFEITTAGTIIPSIALDVAAAAVVNAGSYFECAYLGPAAALGGSWS